MYAKIENGKITETISGKELRKVLQSAGTFASVLPDTFGDYKKIVRPENIIPQGKEAAEEVKLFKGVPTTTYTYTDIKYTQEQLDEHLRNYAKQIEYGGFTMSIDGKDTFIDTTDGSQLKMAGGLLKEMLRNDPAATTQYYVSKSPAVLNITSLQFMGIAQAVGDHVGKVLAAKAAVQNKTFTNMDEIETAFNRKMEK